MESSPTVRHREKQNDVSPDESDTHAQARKATFVKSKCSPIVQKVCHYYGWQGFRFAAYCRWGPFRLREAPLN